MILIGVRLVCLPVMKMVAARRRRRYGGGRMAEKMRHVSAIDGMRAFAVVSVILYHINPAWLRSGFVGVDVFFVISGFVVANSIYANPAKSFRSYLSSFYRRRFARVMPALFAYVLIVAVFGTIFIPKSAASKFVEITGAASLFGMSNVVLLLTSGDYFSTSSEFNTFTHTWSLAVEEQYYLLFPFFSYALIVNNRSSVVRQKLALVLVYAACALSLIAAAYLTSSWRPFAFYMLPTRFWELGIGFLLRLHGQRFGKSFCEWRIVSTVVSAAALLSLILSFWYTPVDNFPFPAALWPCLSTLVLIASMWLVPGTVVDTVLSAAPFQFLGRISYSLYLWHWGVVVLMRWTIGLDTVPLQVAAGVLTLALSYGSYMYVEQPFRYNRRLVNLTVPAFFGAFGLAMLSIATICAGLLVLKPVLGAAASNDAMIWSPYVWQDREAPDCPIVTSKTGFQGGEKILFEPQCAQATRSRLFVVGDSHAGAYRRMMHMVSNADRRPVSIYSLGGCKLFDLDATPPIPGCREFRAAVRADVGSASKAGDILFLAGLYTPRYRDDWGAAVAVTRQGDQLVSGQNSAFSQSVGMFAAMKKNGISILFEAPKPTVSSALYRCADWFNRHNSYCAAGWTVRRGDMEARRAPAMAQIALLRSKIDGAGIWDPLPVLCNTRTCSGFVDGKPLYFDTDHLSGFGNERLFPSFMSAIHAVDRRRMPMRH